MKKIIGKFIGTIFSVCLTLTLLLTNVTEVFAADNEQSSYMQYWTNIEGSFNIQGNVDGQWIQTTYGNYGYGTRLLVDGTSYELNYLQNGAEKLYNNDMTGITQNLSLVNNGRYVKIQYVVRNLSENPQTVSLGSYSDVKIGGNDYAPIYSFDDWSGFYMTDGNSAQFNFIGKNAYGVTDVDTYWYGVYWDNYPSTFTQVSSPSLTGTDSGMAFSWKDRIIAPGESMTLSVLMGVGNVNKAPSIAVTAPETSFGDVVKGGGYEFNGAVSDYENSVNSRIYYAIDEGEPVLAYTFDDAPGAFSAEMLVPSEISTGTHTVTIYAQDSDGAISSSVSRDMNVIEIYDVTFVSNGGSAVDSVTDLPSGNTVSKPEDPTKTGYTFAGWYKDAELTLPWTFGTDTVTADTNIYAKWIQQTFSVNFNTNGGNTLEPVQGIGYGSTFSLSAAPARTGYQFGGWYKDTAFTQVWNFTTDTVSSDTTLYARWLPLASSETAPVNTGDTANIIPCILMLLVALIAGFYSVRRIFSIR
ncbi:InlB B-repeat-containing protein [Parasporobacterium paucivorans]|uniref:Listeria/Bacterioides repeat-containing protein n=1 Tax=Parasporobacterium paucivorans DSM 15970 TaxID=1122934 RepID=A0A1M6EVX9_9FIRM|nr:InlB B-repeat-containing protein [Parasporobacterium paucivorans]SHI89583.1 Listeria/Bacterioides repeat-containing protein [Parasporobacterium paucivorans DSM 15970]